MSKKECNRCLELESLLDGSLDTNHVDMADVCELASELTLRECKDKKITVDKQYNRHETSYTAKAQKIFDYYYDTITKILNI